MIAAGRSYLVSNSTFATLDLSRVAAIDRLEFNGGELNVKIARELIGLVSQSPLGEVRLLIIRNADEMSEVVQNSLLKILEEPPESLIILIVCDHNNRLLPTIQSRLEKITKTNFESSVPADGLRSVTTLIEIKDRNELKSELHKMRIQIHKKLLENGNKTMAARLIAVDKALTELDANCNSKLVLDSLILHFKVLSGTDLNGDD